MRKFVHIALILFLPFVTKAQEEAVDRYETVSDFYSSINIGMIDSNKKTININYNQKILSINSIIKYKYGIICSEDGKVILRTYLVDNKLPVKLYKKSTYYLRLDSFFSKNYYKIKI